LRLACPALEDGVCQIYEHRPLICRKYGMPLYNPQKPEQVFACELNFRPGEEILDSQLVQIHTNLCHGAAEVQAEYNRQGGRRDTKPLNVARAILEDFEGYLPE
jgi:Fe-S-cluster containining protein